jgi:uncharacterized protein YjbJ (UPF0337 family)
MPTQSKEKWVGRARQMLGGIKHKLGGAAYGYKRATAGGEDVLQGKILENRGKLREKLEKANLGQPVSLKT